MQKILTAAEMREVDRLTTEEYGIPSLLLMENAAHAAARVIAEKLGGSVNGKSFLILCGPGNNGGDGAALARILTNQGAYVDLILFGKIENIKGDARNNFDILLDGNFLYTDLQEINAREEWDEFLYGSSQDWDVMVDAVFGTGLSRPLDIWLGNVIRHININNEVKKDFSPRLCVSLDVPTGINSDLSVQTGETFKADLTITFTAPKPGNVLPPASSFNGELVTVDIGSSWSLIDQSPSTLFITEKEEVGSFLFQTNFKHDSHKNKRGHSLMIVGSESYTGAAVLAGNACMRSGVGLVTLAVPGSIKPSVAAQAIPEIIINPVAETVGHSISEDASAQVEPFLEKVHCVGIGCGVPPTEETTRKFVRSIVDRRRCPVVIDAGALAALSPFDITGDDNNPLILTPHIGEMKRLLGLGPDEEFGELVSVVRDFAQKHRVILVLKGERVLIAGPGGSVVVNPTGNSGVGKAGNGDTLAGIITGFVTQAFAIPKNDDFYDPPESISREFSMALEAVIAAVYTAGVAADIAEQKYGKRVMTASDVRDCLADAFKEIGSHNV